MYKVYKSILLLVLFFASLEAMKADPLPLFRFKSLEEADLPLLFDWFKQPYIAQLWKESCVYSVFKEKYIKHIASESNFPLIATMEGRPIAYLIYHYVNDEDRANFPGVDLPHLTIGLDLFIGDPSYLNKGYGTQLIKEFITFLKQKEPICRALTIDPASGNDRAIACYKKVGFKAIGLYVTPYGPTGNEPGPILLMRYDF